MRQLWPPLLPRDSGCSPPTTSTLESEALSSPSLQQRCSLEGRLQGELSQPLRRWPDRPLWQTDRQTQTFGRGDGKEEEMGRSRGPETGGERGGRPDRGLGEADGGRHRAGGMCRGGWLGPDSRDGWRRTTKDSAMERQGGPRRQRQRRRLPSGLFPSQPPRVSPVLGASPAERTPPPASQPVRLLVCPLPATSQPARPSRQGSHRSLGCLPSPSPSLPSAQAVPNPSGTV